MQVCYCVHVSCIIAFIMAAGVELCHAHDINITTPSPVGDMTTHDIPVTSSHHCHVTWPRRSNVCGRYQHPYSSSSLVQYTVCVSLSLQCMYAIHCVCVTIFAMRVCNTLCVCHYLCNACMQYTVCVSLSLQCVYAIHCVCVTIFEMHVCNTLCVCHHLCNACMQYTVCVSPSLQCMYAIHCVCVAIFAMHVCNTLCVCHHSYTMHVCNTLCVSP